MCVSTTPRNDEQPDRPEQRPPSRTRARSDATRAVTLVRLDAIAEAAHGLDERRAELAPQPRDEHFDGVRVAIEVLRVDVLGQLALRDDAAAMVHQVGEHAELVAGELDRRAVDA